MIEVPHTWVTRPFGELNGFYGVSIDPASYPTERFELYSIPVFPTGKPEQPLGSEVGSTKQVVEHNDVLISKINPRINRVWQVGLSIGLRQIASSEWIGFRCTQMDARYFRYYFASPTFRDLLCSDVTGVGGSLTRAQPKRVASFPVPVAPVNEQKRIADKLDTVLTRVDAVNTRLARVASILKRFRQSVLESKTRGNAPDQELRFLLQAVRTGPFGSALHKSDYVQGGIPVVNPMHIIDGEIYPSDHMTVTTETAARLSEFRLMAGDVVIGRRGEMGRCAVVSKAQAGWLCGTGSMILRPKEDVNPHFLRLVLSRPSSIRALEGESVGSTMINLNQGILLSLKVSRPSTEEQAEIVRRVDTLLAFADRLEARLQTARPAVERLTPALLAKAFRGALVAQDPNDEPAHELLRRLQQEAPSTKTKNGRESAA